MSLKVIELGSTCKGYKCRSRPSPRQAIGVSAPGGRGVGSVMVNVAIFQSRNPLGSS